MKTLRLIQKSLLISLLVFTMLIGTALAVTYVFRDKLITVLITQMNKHLATEVKVGKIDLNLFEKFPYLSLKFNDLKIQESGEFSGTPLATAKKVYLTFNPIDLLYGKYEVEQIYLENALVNVIIESNGKGNYHIYKTDSTTKKGTISFDLKKIMMEDVLVNINYRPSDQYYSILHNKAIARFGAENELFNIGLDGDLYVYDINIAGHSYLKEKNITVKSSQSLSLKEKYIVINPSNLRIENSLFHVDGRYDYKDQNFINLNINGEKGNVQTLLSLLPGQIHKEVDGYRSTGNIYFTGKINGPVSDKENPLITVDFGFENASLGHPDMKGKIEKADLKGYFTNGRKKNAESSVLKISKFNATFEGRPITGLLTISNFEDPFYDFSLNGIIDLKGFMEFYPISKIKNAEGLFTIHFSFAGRPNDVRDNPGRIKASGELKIENTALAIEQTPYSFSGLNGHFLINKNDVAVTDFRGKVGENDFRINGYFHNLIGKILFDKERMHITADLQSNYLDINSLIPSVENEANTNRSHSATMNFIKEYHLNLTCKIGNLKYQKTELKNLKGNFELQHPKWVIEDLTAEMCGGKITSNGHVAFRKNIEINAKTSFSDLNINSVFQSFDNFGQDFLTDNHIKGILTGNIELYVPLSSTHFEPDRPKMVGKAKLSIKNGELNGFSPMQKLSLFVEEKELYNIRFSELTNEFTILDNKLSFPEMKIKSNISEITVMGNHSLDNFLDYKLMVPLKNYKKKDKDEAFGAIEDDGRGISRLFLFVKGPGDNFNVGYDTKRTSQKIKLDMKREVNEVSDIFNKRYENRHIKIEKDAQINQDDYFNFED